jgi:Phospholipase_D-nuclease N-terminal
MENILAIIITLALPLSMIFVSLAYIAFVIFTLVDCLRTDESNIKQIPKWAWALIIVFLQFFVPLGAILWFVYGKEKVAKPKKRKVTGPDDDPDFLKGL